MAWWATWPYDVQIFCPVSLMVSPSTTPLVRSENKSEPALGSDSSSAQRSRPVRILGRCFFCSGVPTAMSTGAMR